MDHEAYVRERWEAVRYEPAPVRSHLAHGRVLTKRSGGGEWILSGNSNAPFQKSNPLTKAAAWQAAYDFTVERERLIAEKREEIKWLGGFGHMHPCKDGCCAIRDRILAVLESQLTELTRGMRPNTVEVKHG